MKVVFDESFYLNDISWRSQANEVECESNAYLVSLHARSFGSGKWSFLGLCSEKKWSSVSEDSPQGEWDKMAEKMMFAESQHPVLVHCPEVRRWQIVDTLLCRLGHFSHNYFCKSAQSSRCNRRNV